jgi:hypothetical protein
MGRSPNAAERMDARELPTVKKRPCFIKLPGGHPSQPAPHVG